MKFGCVLILLRSRADELDVSTPELEFEKLMFPFSSVFDPSDWRTRYTALEAELLAPVPLFNRVIPPTEGEPGSERPCASRRGRVQKLQEAIVLHFCTECGAWGAFGYGVNPRAGRQGRWYCAAHRPQGATP